MKQPLSNLKKRFTTKDLAEAFKHFDAGLVALERLDPSAERFANVSRIIQDGLSCYKIIYDEKQEAAVQSTLHLFIKVFVNLPVSNS